MSKFQSKLANDIKNHEYLKLKRKKSKDANIERTEILE